MKFSDLGLSDSVLNAVQDAGYETPTPIQQKAIPILLGGGDLVGCAQTGTGKTASFTLPMIHLLAKGRAKARMPRSLILEPTRELATQVAENFETYGKYNRLSKALLIGGRSFEDQNRIIDRGVDVLIATPGRLLDHFERGGLLLRGIEILVIDEADRMLDMGFIPDVERIIALINPNRQTMLFSATMPPEIRRLADRYISHAQEVAVAPPATTAATVEQSLVMVAENDKRPALRALLKHEPVKNAFVFCNRKRDVDIVFKSLTKHGFQPGMLHGDMPQERRLETLANFKAGEIKILVCSDVAARGLDIQGMSHVILFDVPFNAEDYVHRIGRTGRAGMPGRAFTIATRDDKKLIQAVEKLTGEKISAHEIDEEQLASNRSQRYSPRRQRGVKAAPRQTRPPRTEVPTKERDTGDADALEAVEAKPSLRHFEPDETQLLTWLATAENDNQKKRQATRKRVSDTQKSRKTNAEKGKRPQKADRTKTSKRKSPATAKKRRATANNRTPDMKEPVIGMGDHVPDFLRRP